MKCSNTEMRELIFGYVDGTVDATQQNRIEQHLSRCPSCRQLESEYRLTIADVEAVLTESAREHVDNETLVDFVDGARDLPKSEKEAIELHLDLCSQCSRKVEMLRTAASASAASEAPKFRWPTLSRISWIPATAARRPVVALAAAAVIALVAVPVVRLLITQPATGPVLEFAQTADVVWLQELTRDEVRKPTASERNGWAQLGVYFEPFFAEESYLLQLQSPDGRLLGERKVSPDDMSAKGGLLVRVRTEDLAQGEYRLILTVEKSTGVIGPVQTVYPFILLKQ